MHYKFLDSAHVSNVLVEGAIVISSFEYFRRLEATEWDGIADKLEGATELKMPEYFVATENSPELEQLNKANIGLGQFKQFAKLETGGVINMSGTRFIHQMPDAYIFSASWRVTFQMFSTGGNTRLLSMGLALTRSQKPCFHHRHSKRYPVQRAIRGANYLHSKDRVSSNAPYC
jgi:hypothetical protein